MSKNKFTTEEQFLTLEQAKELQELGVDTYGNFEIDTDEYGFRTIEKRGVFESDSFGNYKKLTPTLSVAEMMEMLPIINEEKFYIQITRECEIEYRYNNFSEFVYVIKYTESSNKKSFKVSGSILRDVLFEMLKWFKQNKLL